MNFLESIEIDLYNVMILFKTNKKLEVYTKNK